MEYREVHFSKHAIVQMFQREIQVEDVEYVLKTGRRVKEYPDDKPYPSFLILGFVRERPLHVLAATDQQRRCYIVTAYEPDPDIWNEDFTIKK